MNNTYKIVSKVYLMYKGLRNLLSFRLGELQI